MTLAGGLVEHEHVTLEERSRVRCALAVGDGRVHLGWHGNDGRYNLLSSTDGLHFAGKRTLNLEHDDPDAPGRPPRRFADPPQTLAAIAVSATDGLVIAYKQVGTEVALWAVDRGVDARFRLGESTVRPPAIAPYGDELLVAWSGTDTRINLLRAHGGRIGDKVTIPHKSPFGPALAVVDGEPWLAWMAKGRTVGLGPVGRLRDPEREIRLDHRTAEAPAIVGYAGDLALAWLGRDHHINLAVLRSGAVVHHQVTEHTTTESPALAVHGDRLVLAWRERSLNLLLHVAHYGWAA